MRRLSATAERDHGENPARARQESAAQRLRDLQHELSDHAVLFGDLLTALGSGAIGLLLLLIGAASLVPGSAPVFGAAQCVLALSFMAGKDSPWMPAWLRERRISGEGLKRGIAWLVPRLEWLERHLRPRRQYMLRGPMLRLLGLACLVNGILIVLPIPFGNTVPAIAVLLLALGLTACDGLAVLAGLVVTGIALLVDGGIIFLGYQGLTSLFGLVR
jgi:hypothetical protein